MLTLTADAFARAWTEDGMMRWEIPLVSPPYGLAVSPDNRLALSGSNSGRLNLLDLTNPGHRVLEGHRAAIYRLVFSPDGEHFACASHDHQASIWQRDGSLRRMLPHEGKCEEVLFSPDGRQLASASMDATARLWETATGKELHCFHHDADVLAVAFSPDGRTLATGGRDNQISFWDTATGEPTREPIPCGGAVAELRYVPGSGGESRLLVLTWEPALLVLALP